MSTTISRWKYLLYPELRKFSSDDGETESILGNAIREGGGEIEWETELTNITQQSESVIATLCCTGGRRETAASFIFA
jgi:hypothetical protein